MPKLIDIPTSQIILETSSRGATTLIGIATDILNNILQLLYHTPGAAERETRYNEEFCRGPRTREDRRVWPGTLCPFIVVGQLIQGAANDGALKKFTLRLESPIPPEMWSALGSVPQLSLLEVHDARFDRPSPPPNLSFAALDTLLICICGFNRVVRASNIDRMPDSRNVALLLRNLTHRLMTLRISGDLLSSDFFGLKWPHLGNFTVTEHPPTPYIPVPDLVSQTPALRQLSILFSADSTRAAGEIYPPFRLGTPGGELLTNHSPLLTSVTLSNLEPSDPIFGQLRSSVMSLHLLAMRDFYAPGKGSSRQLRDAPLTNIPALTVIQHISHPEDLAELSFTLKEFPAAQLIDAIALKFPRLQALHLVRALQLGFSVHPRRNFQLEDVRDHHILEALQRLPLAHLKISLDFLERLQAVAFSWDPWRWWWVSGLELFVWQTWDRSVLLGPPTPPPVPQPDLPEPMWLEEISDSD
ncbi:hypothetical protein DFH09DRAFT_1409440 [Mycena vulgaris]|nr:hypothetical protein DFH09DRAFT_1409440 [Mycena vulgaris]